MEAVARPKKYVKLCSHRKTQKGWKDAERKGKYFNFNLMVILLNKWLFASFQPCSVFWSKGSLRQFFWPCGRAATIWPKTAVALQFLLRNSHFLLKYYKKQNKNINLFFGFLDIIFIFSNFRFHVVSMLAFIFDKFHERFQVKIHCYILHHVQLSLRLCFWNLTFSQFKKATSKYFDSQ